MAEHSERFERGLAKMMEYQPKNNPDVASHTKLVEFYKDLDPDLANLIIEWPFGEIYTRDALTNQQQTMVTISALTALGTEPQLELHINSCFNVGLTKKQVVGTMIHLLPYIGYPRVLNGLALVKKVLAQRTDVV